MSITWTETVFRKYYSMPGDANGSVFTTYSRVGWRYWRGPEFGWGYPETPSTSRFPDHPLNEYRWRVERLRLNFPQITDTSRVLVLGCGYGFLPETFQWSGIPQGRVCGADNSAFIQGNLASEAHPNMQGKVVNRSMTLGASNAQMRGSLRTAAPDVTGFGATAEFFDFVITESVLESFTPAERTAAFYTTLQSYLKAGLPASQVIHIVADGWDATADGGSPPLSLEEWAATRPQHSWMSYWGDMRVIPGV